MVKYIYKLHKKVYGVLGLYRIVEFYEKDYVNLSRLIINLYEQKVINYELLRKFDIVRNGGNLGVHYHKDIIYEPKIEDVLRDFESLEILIDWYFNKSKIDLDKVEWESAKRINNVESYNKYIKGNGSRRHKQQALKKIKEFENIKKHQDEDCNYWRKAVKEDSIYSYKKYLNNGSLHIKEAELRIKELENIERDEEKDNNAWKIEHLNEEKINAKLDEEAWNKAVRKGTLEAYTEYAEMNIKLKKHIEEAEGIINRLSEVIINDNLDDEAWETARRLNTIDSYSIYINSNVKFKKYLEKAEDMIEKIISYKMNTREYKLSEGDRYFYGIGVAKGYRKALDYYVTSFRIENNEAIRKLAHMYFTGIEVE